MNKFIFIIMFLLVIPIGYSLEVEDISNSIASTFTLENNVATVDNQYISISAYPFKDEGYIHKQHLDFNPKVSGKVNITFRFDTKLKKAELSLWKKDLEQVVDDQIITFTCPSNDFGKTAGVFWCNYNSIMRDEDLSDVNGDGLLNYDDALLMFDTEMFGVYPNGSTFFKLKFEVNDTDVISVDVPTKTIEYIALHGETIIYDGYDKINPTFNHKLKNGYHYYTFMNVNFNSGVEKKILLKYITEKSSGKFDIYIWKNVNNVATVYMNLDPYYDSWDEPLIYTWDETANYYEMNIAGGTVNLGDVNDTEWDTAITKVDVVASAFTINENDDAVAQSFTESTDYNITALGVMLGYYYSNEYALANDFVWKLRVETDSGGNPSGILAHPDLEILKSVRDFPQCYGSTVYNCWATFKVNSTETNITMNASQTYHLVLTIEQAYTYATGNVARTSSSKYANGNAKYKNNGGAWTNYASYDLGFALIRDGDIRDEVGGTVGGYWNPSVDRWTHYIGWGFDVIGDGVLTGTGGQQLYCNRGLTEFTGYCIQVEYGGTLNLEGNPSLWTGFNDRFVMKNGAGTSSNYAGIIIRYNGNVFLNWVSVDGYGRTIYGNSNYDGSFLVKNSQLRNDEATTTYGIVVYLTSNSEDKPGEFNNVTIWRGNTYNYYTLLSSAATYTYYKFIDTNIVRTGGNYRDVYEGSRTGYGYPMYFNCSAGIRNSQTSFMGNDHVQNVYQTSKYLTGSIAKPRVIADGSPVENATITVSIQTHRQDFLGGNNTGVKDSLVTPKDFGNIHLFRSRDYYSPFWVTNSDGYPVDVDGNTVLTLPYVMKTGTSETISGYYSGNNTNVRPITDETWNGDGTDWGIIITASHPDHCGKMVIVSGEENYLDDMDISCGGGSGGVKLPLRRILW